MLCIIGLVFMSQEGAVNKFRNWSTHSHIKVNTQKLLLGIEKYFNIFVLKDHRSNPPPPPHAIISCSLDRNFTLHWSRNHWRQKSLCWRISSRENSERNPARRFWCFKKISCGIPRQSDARCVWRVFYQLFAPYNQVRFFVVMLIFSTIYPHSDLD